MTGSPGSPGRPEAPPTSYAADPMLASPVGRNREERKKIGTLEHRLTYLREQAEHPGAPQSGWRDAERAALGWALRRIAEAERAPQEVATILARFVGTPYGVDEGGAPGAPYRYLTVYEDGNDPAATLALDGTVDLTRDEVDALLTAYPNVKGADE